jgi:hypothetical protein
MIETVRFKRRLFGTAWIIYLIVFAALVYYLTDRVEDGSGNLGTRLHG